MSVIGLDFGNESSVVGIARKKGIDVLLNNESKRETPSMVGFGDKQRSLGTAASAGYTMNYKNTVNNLKRFIGRQYDELDVATEAEKCFYKLCKCERTGGVLMEVRYMGEARKFTPTEVLAMLLGELQRIAEAEHGTKVPDCVISVPCYFTDVQRHAVMDAASIAGLKCLRLINDMTAVALGYGIYKNDLPEPDAPPLTVAFVDVGHSDMQVAIVSYNKGKMKVLGHAYDRALGGRDFDDCLVDHFAEEFKEKYKIDVKSNPRATFRLREAMAKAKKVLSANAETPVNIECLMDDTDVRSKITRETFEGLAANLLSRVLAPCEKALAKSGVTVEDVAIVELVGNSSRIPAISSQISAFFKKEISRHLNASECVARGCALQGAMLSPTFRFTRTFDVEDASCFPVSFSYPSEDGTGEETKTVFAENNVVPSTKLLTFFRSSTFELRAAFSEPGLLPDGAPTAVGKFSIGPIPAPKAGDEKQKIKVKLRLNMHGTVGVESAQLLEEEIVEVEEPAPAAEAPMETDGAAAAAGAENGEKKEGEAPSEPAAPMETEDAKPATVMVKKKNIKKTEVPVQSFLSKMSSADTEKGAEREFDMCLQDRVIEETKEKKNELEEYVLKMRSRLHGDLEAYIAPGPRDAMVKVLTETEDWLYEDGEDETKGVYTDKLNGLKEQGNAIVMRYTEDQSRSTAAEGLTTVAKQFKAMARSGDAKYAHITQEELKKVADECDDALIWLTDKMGIQDSTPKTEAPVLLCSDITKKRDVLLRVCEPIMNKPAPKPEPKPEPKPAAAGEAKPDGAAADTEMKDGGEAAEATDTKMSNADDLD